MTDLLALADYVTSKGLDAGADEIEVFVQRAKIMEVSLERNDMQSGQSIISSGLGIRAIKNHGLAFSAINQLDETQGKKAAEQVVKMVMKSPPSPHYALPESQQLTHVPGLYDSQSESYSIDEVLDNALQLLKTAKDYDKRITIDSGGFAAVVGEQAIVTSKGIVKFHNWTIEIGPQIMEYKTDIWKQIEKDLENNDVKSAASKLRWNSEGFFGELCDNIKAKVTYKLSGRYELGDFISNAIKQYRALLKEAVKVAKSWEKQDNVEMLGKIDNKVKQISEHAKIEQWIINDSVHYNNWANFSVNDFQPVVDAFQALYGLFICDKCGNMIYVNT